MSVRTFGPRRVIAVVGVALLVGAGLAAAPARAVTLYRFSGIVTDAIGRPLSDVVVYDGFKGVKTDTAGRYVLEESSTGTFDLTTHRRDLLNVRKTVDVIAPADTTVDFTPFYIARSFASPRYASSAADGTTTHQLEVRTTLPPDGTCAVATAPDGAAHQMALGTGPNTDPWKATWRVPVRLHPAQEGRYDIAGVVTDCATSTPLSQSSVVSVYVDNTAPTITDVSPGGYATNDVTIGATVHDASGPADTTITLDDVEVLRTLSSLPAVHVTVADGLHTFAIRAVDAAGNAAEVVRTFTVDSTAPTASSPTPTGTVVQLAPQLAITLADTGVGIDPNRLSMVLTGTLEEAAVDASFDPLTGTLAYQIPSTPTGATFGKRPLLPGGYTIAVTATDLAGNTATTSWTFDVAIS